ncbi:quinone oxidoreductase family protein [Fructilactobacillus lindneri]|uniref:quinone oxidoreductase family protein n=1 Tax=Fructilactobacillus lindneri TaxID=53444 RepID=UPI000A86E34D|nr:zinc-binding alcohol dehydrogenase family protein [Fructilactobacillus lindneri]
MTEIKAAVVTDFNHYPKLTNFTAPTPAANEKLINVEAAAVYNLVRGRANGSHYSSTTKFPFIPGVDGVGRLTDGNPVYFFNFDGKHGSIAEQTAAPTNQIVALPSNITHQQMVKVAAGMNPAMSSWMALVLRVGDLTGKDVLIMGVTGEAGKMAVQIAKHLGSKQIIGVGRNREKLADVKKLGATKVISLLDDPEILKPALLKTANVDVVLDYLWGDVTQNYLQNILPARFDHSKELTWIEIGNMAGRSLDLPGAVLRSINLLLVGSGLGSFSNTAYATQFKKLAELIAHGELTIKPKEVPLSELNEKNWLDNSQRTVYTMKK